MANTEADDAVWDTLAQFGSASFSTFQFAEKYKSLFPTKWKQIEDEYGAGGKDSGTQYSAFSFISQVLNRLHNYGDVQKLDYRKSPPGYGNRVIRYWTLDRTARGGSLYPDEANLPPDQANQEFLEGTGKKVLVNRYERDPKAREKCIEHYGLSCQVCGLDFEKRYGAHGAGFIHVHHLVPLHETGKQYAVDPIKDLLPVCPNCHAMLHYGKSLLSIDDLRTALIEAQNLSAAD